MDEWISQLTTALQEWGPNLVAALAIAVVGWIAAKIVRGAVRRAATRAKADPILVRFAASIAYMASIALVVIAVLGRLGVNTTSFAAVVAAAGLAIGLAFQDSLSNFAAGVLLIFFRPFQVGDYIEAGGVSGSVEEVQVFTTVLKTPDAKKVILGNAAILADPITNYSAYPQRRVDMVFGIGYDDDLRQAKATLERILAENDAVLETPEPVVEVLELADSSVNFAVRPWTATADYWKVYFAIHAEVKRVFDAEGLSIPFPQTDVHLHRVDAA